MKPLTLNHDGADLARELLDALEPGEQITVAEWAARSRVIAIGNSEPGAWRNDRAPYLVEPMEAITDDAVNTLVVTGCSQSGKTALAENVLGHAVCCDPCTLVWATPNDASAETASVRFDSMIASTPELRERFGTRSARSQVNNLSLKEYAGGKVAFASAGSPSSLASHPARIIVGDEIDRWTLSLRREGCPVAIVRARTTTFARGKSVFLSSPTQEGASRIEALAAEGDLREWLWLCECGVEFVPQWESVKWTPGNPGEAAYHCDCCGLILDDGARWRAMQRGRWQATKEAQPGVRSYRFRGLSSPWLRMSLLASEYEQARNNPRKLAPFFNTRLGLPYENDQGEGAEAEEVKLLAEPYDGQSVPTGAVLVTAGIDVQGGWCAVVIAAHGEGDEVWALQWHEVNGDIKDPQTRRSIERLIFEQKWKHRSGDILEVEAVACDSGYETQTILEWSQAMRQRGKRFFATKGVTGWARGLWERGADQHRSMARHFIVGIDQGKQSIVAGLAMTEGGPGKVHTRRGFEDHAPHFWQWACAEHLVLTETAGGTKKEWKVRKSARRNEALDCLVLALAVAHSADFAIGARLTRLRETGSINAPAADFKALAMSFVDKTAPATAQRN